MVNPTQQALLDELGAKADARPTFDPELRAALRRYLEDELDQLDPKDVVFISKRTLANVHTCEAMFVAEQQGDFSWSIPLARGTVAHKAIELSVLWRGDFAPLDLVDEAIARLTESDDSIADWLQTCSEGELAELRSEVNNLLVAFLDCWPPLDRRWSPVVEYRVGQELSGELFSLRGRPDLSLGSAPDGPRANRVFVDLKTGRAHGSHRDDLRFYAVVETLKVGVPPRLLATYYLDQGRLVAEDVTEDLLYAAATRIVDGARRMVDLLHNGETPTKRPGPQCRWCPLREECDEGQAWLANADDW